ncbi:hypothetical protein GCM10011332_09460 [Terasakiella brassicae]|uniref:Transposase IS116/IS110/IS902 C-terminal domain-containing protein n=1 Tax=Terasakiella brassicae TaxID=1634917 RepID=A0A917BVA7_9PROT|nr:hypothetical protein GCM10011332_09460 [Terasakiella brassicae]
MVKQRTRLLNKVHALFNRHGIKIKKEKFTSKRSLERINMDVFSKVEHIEITLVRDQALSLTQAIKDADVEIERFAASLDGFEGLLSIKGIGSRTAAIFLSAIGNVNDFEDENKLAAYFCIVPRVSQSNETDHRGRITKRGNKLVRTALVQCSLITIRYSGYLNSYYHRIKGRRDSGKAIIATARKLLKIIYDTLKNGWIFKDFTTFTLAENKVPAGQTS